MNARRRERAEPATLLAALTAWREATAGFHADRQLADRVLLATGWQCSPDGDRVRWHFGVNPEVSTWEPSHPHPIRSVDDAMGQLPFGWDLARVTRRNGGGWHVTAALRSGRTRLHADGAGFPVALCALAVQAWDLQQMVDTAMADYAGAHPADEAAEAAMSRQLTGFRQPSRRWD